MLVYEKIAEGPVALADMAPQETLGASDPRKHVTTGAVVCPSEVRPVLSISAYKRQSIGTAATGRKGIRADLRVAPLADCTVYQVVEYRYAFKGVTSSKIYTEAWTVKCRGRKPRAAIEQNGTDSCLVSNSHVQQSAGELRLITTAWIEPGKVDRALGVGAGSQLWGSLRGVMGARPIPDGSQVLEREIWIIWPKGGPFQISIDGKKWGLPSGTKGSDCVLPTLILADFGAGTGSNVQIGAKACRDQGIDVKVGMTVEPIEALLFGPKNRKDPLYEPARFLHSVEELEPNSVSFDALHIINGSLPCAANRVNLLNEFLGWCVPDSRVPLVVESESWSRDK
jgi:hypothetical protein